jgi:toluene monooxygenase system ferredoxin subunit
MSFAKAASLGELWCGEMRGLTMSGRRVLVVHLGGHDAGCVAAFEDKCPHLGVALSEGTLDGDVLTCRAHGWSYDVRTGRGVNPEDTRLVRFAARVDGDDVLVDPAQEVEAAG